MTEKTISIHRHELYDMEWSEPISRLAGKYGFTDVWLAKICRKYNIPRPGRGYWAQKQAGKRIPAARLPNRSYDPVIHIRVHPAREKLQREVRDKLDQQRVPTRIIVPAALTDPHPFVHDVATHLASAKQDDKGILAIKANCLDIQVSRGCADRALRIMDTLIKALLNAGFGISISKGSTVVSICDANIRISLQEETKRRRINAVEHDLKGYYQFGYKLYSDHAAPSGILSMVIDDKGFPYGVLTRKAWRDSETKRLEDSLGNFVCGLIKAAEVKKRLRQQETGPAHTPED